MFSSSGEERRQVMSTKMGFWRWALASVAILIATGTAGFGFLARKA
jgi:anti-sigma-K factor RskA